MVRTWDGVSAPWLARAGSAEGTYTGIIFASHIDENTCCMRLQDMVLKTTFVFETNRSNSFPTAAEGTISLPSTPTVNLLALQRSTSRPYAKGR